MMVVGWWMQLASIFDGISGTEGGLGGMLLGAITLAWRLAVAYRAELLANTERETLCRERLASAAATLAARDSEVAELRRQLAEERHHG